eukprot:g18207.t1
MSCPLFMVATYAVCIVHTIQHLKKLVWWKRGRADEEHTFETHDRTLRILILPLFYGVMSCQGVVRMWGVTFKAEKHQWCPAECTDSECRLGLCMPTQCLVSAPGYDACFWLGDLYESYALFTFGLIVLEYLSQRLRRGMMEAQDALKTNQVPRASDSFSEMSDSFRVLLGQTKGLTILGIKLFCATCAGQAIYGVGVNSACPPFCWWSYTRANLLYASLLCIECFFISILHVWAWSAEEAWFSVVTVSATVVQEGAQDDADWACVPEASMLLQTSLLLDRALSWKIGLQSLAASATILFDPTDHSFEMAEQKRGAPSGPARRCAFAEDDQKRRQTDCLGLCPCVVQGDVPDSDLHSWEVSGEDLFGSCPSCLPFPRHLTARQWTWRLAEINVWIQLVSTAYEVHRCLLLPRAVLKEPWAC